MWNKPPVDRSERIIGAQYFLYFGVLGMYLPYFNLYCYHIGFSGFQIGALSGLRSITLVLFPLIWSTLADRFQIRRPLYIACNFISTALWLFYLFTTDFWPLFAITAVYGAFYAPLISFLETFTMETLGRSRNRYGRIRAWGSLSFILIVVLLGRAIDAFSVDLILVTILFGSVLLAMVSVKIPRIETPPATSPRPQAGTLLNRRMVVFLISAFLMLTSHGTYYGFFSIHLESIGYGKTFIGGAWALASGAEILVMIRSVAIFRRFAIEQVLMFSFAVAGLRWLILSVAISPAAIVVAQVLHAVTYGAFHMASILYVDRLSPKAAKTMGQAVNNAITYGLGLMAGFFLNGWLYDTLGAGFLFATSGVIALCGGLLFKAGRHPDDTSRTEA